MQEQAVSDLALESTHWLWPGWLPLGKLALLDGDPGLGKSLLTLDLCARLSTGQPMPDGQPGPGVCPSLLLEAEDGQGDTVRPRLQALGADLARIFVIRRGPLGELPRLPSQINALDAVVARTGARLLVIDPITEFLDSSVLLNCDHSVRRALLPLRQLGEQRCCTILMNRHLNKTPGSRALYRGGGSIAFQAACRLTWLLARDPDAPADRRVLAQVKNNLAPLQPSLSLQVRHHDAGPELAWLGSHSLTSDALLEKPARSDKPSALEQARAFLADFLKAGPQRTQQIWDAALAQGLSKRTLQRAQSLLSIRTRWVREDVPRAYWLMPGQELPGTTPSDPNSLETIFRALEEQFPPRTPLDEDE